MKKHKRKTRSDKFPLILHPTGQYCKKINGKIYYFGTNKKQALKRYLDQATYLHGCPYVTAKGSDGSMPLKQLCDLCLGYQHARVLAGVITARHYTDQLGSLNKLMPFLDKGRKIRAISTLNLQNYRRQLQNAHSTSQRPNSHISTLKAMFHWARRNDILERIPNIDAISKGKIVSQPRHTFDSKQITKPLFLANVQMRAMVWLGLNCGLGCMDCARLRWTDLDPEKSRARLPRNKTAVPRDLPLWPETIKALKRVPRSGPLVFYTVEGHPWVRTLAKAQADGTMKYTTVNAISSLFGRLLAQQGEWLGRVVCGYSNYHAIPGNAVALETFRRGGRSRLATRLEAA